MSRCDPSFNMSSSETPFTVLECRRINEQMSRSMWCGWSSLCLPAREPSEATASCRLKLPKKQACSPSAGSRRRNEYVTTLRGSFRQHRHTHTRRLLLSSIAPRITWHMSAAIPVIAAIDSSWVGAKTWPERRKGGRMGDVCVRQFVTSRVSVRQQHWRESEQTGQDMTQESCGRNSAFQGILDIPDWRVGI